MQDTVTSKTAHWTLAILLIAVGVIAIVFLKDATDGWKFLRERVIPLVFALFVSFRGALFNDDENKPS
jgi:hypothetical protein